MQCRSRTRRAVSLAIALLAGLGHAAPLAAQADGTPIRIRTAARPGKWITGRAAGITTDSIGIVPDTSADTLRYARNELHRLEVSVGRKSNAGRGALIGGGILGGLGVVLGVACVADTDEGDFIGCEGSDVPLFGLAGAATGAAVGGLIGALSHREKWEAVEIPRSTAAGEP